MKKREESLLAALLRSAEKKEERERTLFGTARKETAAEVGRLRHELSSVHGKSVPDSTMAQCEALLELAKQQASREEMVFGHTTPETIAEIARLTFTLNERLGESNALRKEVAVSYSRRDALGPDLIALRGACAKEGLDLWIDTEAMSHRDSVDEFEVRVGRAEAVVFFLSENFLRSRECAMELRLFCQRGDLRNRAFPVLLPGVNLRDPIFRGSVIKYWNGEIVAYEKEKAEIPGVPTPARDEQVKHLREFVDSLDKTMYALGDMNAQTLEWHRADHFQTLAADIARALSVK